MRAARILPWQQSREKSDDYERQAERDSSHENTRRPLYDSDCDAQELAAMRRFLSLFLIIGR
jgi:hypothetical protein